MTNVVVKNTMHHSTPFVNSKEPATEKSNNVVSDNLINPNPPMDFFAPSQTASQNH
jgi:hypothetical protein